MIELSTSHHDAVNRRRRIIVKHDPNMEVGLDLQQQSSSDILTLEDEAGTRMYGHVQLSDQSVFAYADEADTQIDSIFWDVDGPATFATWPNSKILEPFKHKALLAWWDRGLDLVQALIDATQQRGFEAFWSYRVSPGDFLPENDDDVDELPPLKKAHPDWLIRQRRWSGDWNYAVPQVREFQLSLLSEIAHLYPLDGIQLDFSRGVPILPPGEEWQHRDALTDFIRSVRLMTLEVEQARGKPFLLATKVPQNIEGCCADGMDVQTWAEQDLVDIFALGCRSMDVDIAAFRTLTAGHHIKLAPCIETHHATAGYKWQPVEFFRGVYGNWWQQGADSVMTFNWSASLQKEKTGKFGHRYDATRAELQAYKEIGSPGILAGKNKFFAVERRGGMPWTGGFFNRNHTAPLPVALANFGRPENLIIRICDHLSNLTDEIKSVLLRVVLLGGRQGDQIETRLNSITLQPTVHDHDWKDRQIHSPAPQPNTCGLLLPEVNPDQKLLRLDYNVPLGLCLLGENQVRLRILDRLPYEAGQDIAVEKVEVHVEYK